MTNKKKHGPCSQEMRVQEKLWFPACRLVSVMTITDSWAREGQESTDDARDVLFCIPSLTRICFQPLPSVAGHRLYKTMTNFVKEIAGCQMQRFTLQYGQDFA